MATLSIIRPLHRSYKTSIWVDLAMFVSPMAARPGPAEFRFCDAKLKTCTFEFGFCSAKLKLYTFEFGFLSLRPKLCLPGRAARPAIPAQIDLSSARQHANCKPKRVGIEFEFSGAKPNLERASLSFAAQNLNRKPKRVGNEFEFLGERPKLARP